MASGDHDWFWTSTDLEEFGDRLDERGRAWAPVLERGSDEVPVVVPLPDAAALLELDAGELHEVLHRYGMTVTADVSTDLASQYLQRFGITSDDPRWAREMERLTGDMARLPALGAARRAGERYETLLAADGEMGKDSVYLAEGDDPCEECMALTGDVMPLGERIAAGLMPGDRCLGGDLCQCAIGIYDD